MENKKIVIGSLICAALLSLVGCSSPTYDNTDVVSRPVLSPHPAKTQRPTITIRPTATVRPTQTVRPSATYKPSNTVSPTRTPWKPKPAQTNVPTSTYKPSATVRPTQTVRPAQTVKPSQTKKPTQGTRLSLDTTGNFSGLKLKRESDRNDFVAYEIKNSKTNRVSSLNGTEPQVKVAVDAFNEFKNNNSQFVAYKFLEFHQFDSAEVQKLRKQMKNNNITEYYRVTLEIYQYDRKSNGPYNDTSDDPHYLRVTMYKEGNQYKRLTSVSMR